MSALRTSARAYLTLVALVLAWEIGSRARVGELLGVSATQLPPPSAALRAGAELVANGTLHQHVLASLRRVLTGWAGAAAIAIPLGVAMAWWRRLDEYLDLVVELVRPIPPIAWIPLSILWLGIGEGQMAFIAGVGSFFAILLSTIHGVRRIDPRYLRAALCLGATRGAILRKVVLRGALPEIFTGLRVGLGLSWMSLVAAELVAAHSGVTFLSLEAQQVLRTDRVLLTMALVGALGIGLDRLLRRLADRIAPWAAETV